jgi:hypothetical protein
MSTGGWVFLCVVAAGGAAAAGFFLGRRRGLRHGALMGGGGVAAKGHPLNAPVVNPKVAAAALAMSAAQGKPQKV